MNDIKTLIHQHIINFLCSNCLGFCKLVAWFLFSPLLVCPCSISHLLFTSMLKSHSSAYQFMIYFLSILISFLLLFLPLTSSTTSSAPIFIWCALSRVGLFFVHSPVLCLLTIHLIAFAMWWFHFYSLFIS